MKDGRDNEAKVFVSQSPTQTMELGRRLGIELHPGEIVGLSGELGSGKTCFTKGIAIGLDLDPACVTSPSFALVNEYEGGRIIMYHIDAYRLQHVQEFLVAGLEEYLHMGGVAVLEWADKWPEILPPESIRVRFDIMGESQEGHLLKILVWGAPAGFYI